MSKLYEILMRNFRNSTYQTKKSKKKENQILKLSFHEKSNQNLKISRLLNSKSMLNVNQSIYSSHIHHFYKFPRREM